MSKVTHLLYVFKVVSFRHAYMTGKLRVESVGCDSS